MSVHVVSVVRNKSLVREYCHCEWSDAKWTPETYWMCMTNHRNGQGDKTSDSLRLAGCRRLGSEADEVQDSLSHSRRARLSCSSRCQLLEAPRLSLSGAPRHLTPSNRAASSVWLPTVACILFLVASCSLAAVMKSLRCSCRRGLYRSLQTSFVMLLFIWASTLPSDSARRVV